MNNLSDMQVRAIESIKSGNPTAYKLDILDDEIVSSAPVFIGGCSWKYTPMYTTLFGNMKKYYHTIQKMAMEMGICLGA